LLVIRAVIDSFSQSSYYRHPVVCNRAIRYCAKTVKRIVEILSLPDSRIIHMRIKVATCLENLEKSGNSEVGSWLPKATIF